MKLLNLFIKPGDMFFIPAQTGESAKKLNANATSGEALREFFKEMNIWELKHQPIIRSMFDNDAPQKEIEVAERICSDELAEIFFKYGVTGRKNTARVVGLGLAWPPTYEAEPEILEIADDGKSSAMFKVRKANGAIYRYSMKKIDGKWILKMREFLDVEDKWRPFSF